MKNSIQTSIFVLWAGIITIVRYSLNSCSTHVPSSIRSALVIRLSRSIRDHSFIYSKTGLSCFNARLRRTLRVTINGRDTFEPNSTKIVCGQIKWKPTCFFQGFLGGFDHLHNFVLISRTILHSEPADIQCKEIEWLHISSILFQSDLFPSSNWSRIKPGVCSNCWNFVNILTSKLLLANLGKKKCLHRTVKCSILTLAWIGCLSLFWPNYLEHISLSKFWCQYIDKKQLEHTPAMKSFDSAIAFCVEVRVEVTSDGRLIENYNFFI